MSKKAAEKESLPKGLSAFEQLVIASNKETRREIKQLNGAMTEMAQNVTVFIAHSTKTHSELLNVITDTQRIDKSMQKLGQRQSEFKKETNESIQEMSGQIGDVKQTVMPMLSTYTHIKKILWGIVGAVSITASVAFFMGEQ